MRDRRDIRARHADGGSIRGIARDIVADRNSIRRALAEDARLDYQRPTLADQFEPAVRDVLYDYPRLTVQQVAEIIAWPASRRSLSSLVARIRPLVLERERLALVRPRTGTLTSASASVRVGVASVGRMEARRIDDIQEAARGTCRAT